MAIKTGRTWLDSKKPDLADVFFSLSVKSLEVLYSRLIARGDGKADINIAKTDVEKDLFRVHSYQAESVCISAIMDTAQLLKYKQLPCLTGYLSLLCYNFGVDTYKLKKFEESSFWLSQSYDIGKMDKKYSPGAAVQAKVLRLLATVYFEWDCKQFQEKALNAVTLANKENVHAAGIYLKIQILLKSGAQDESMKAAITALLDVEVPLELCLSTVKVLMAEDREALAFEFLKRVIKHYETSPELGSALVLHIELLLQRGKELLGKQKIGDVITGSHYTGKQLSPQILGHLHLLLWDRASKNFEARNYSESLQWYNYSLSFYSVGQMDQNLAKLQRNRASCFLHLQQLDKAKEAIKEAERCDPESIFTQFSVYKIAILENNTERALEAVKTMGKLAENPIQNENRLLVAENAASNLLSLAAQIALENEQQDVAMKALRCLCEHSEDRGQVFTALRQGLVNNLGQLNKNICVTALAEKLTYKNLFPTAVQKVSQLSPAEGLSAEKKSEEANWFRKIAWNSALQCESSPDMMRDFFMLSYQRKYSDFHLQLSQFCPSDKAILIGQKTCLLMAAAASLELGRESSELSQQSERLTQALEHIQACWEIWKTLKASGEFSKDPTDTLLLLYEFEARAKLNDPRLETVLESVLELQQIEIKTLETIASLAMEPPAYFPSLCKKALRIALSLHKKRPDADLSRCSQCLHSLIQLSLPTGVLEVEPWVLEEVWGYYEEALFIIGSAQGEFPEVEILWLLTRAWNTGILLYSLAQYPEAEKWCGLGMSFLRHLGTLQESYQTQMSGLYAEVLDRLDRAKRNLIIEE
ncbi:TEX11 protein, partial [Amia calva]|nr:TEX11 protein [Amia calva]